MKIRKVTNKISRHDELSICSCGSIHFIPSERFQKAIDTNTEIMLICTNCGQNKVFGANDGFDELFGETHELYTTNIDIDSYNRVSLEIDDSFLGKEIKISDYTI